ncbi:dihydroorotase [Salpingoeca rosetta]|uniref:dihydroorotase n=1 Tax=Salpingoeca rosetta (strain ATCC 50818 / BSB-021) TaxID=946362 RepID=F2U1K6_SALR5|nr:dihydroorotase [Salpingoeca rosetta]EGD81508.1 dihydroorotase [Salpingoeca rosetta]|eukprot:XP_004996712.1 dihydroorotase [Salpingoeca rosetta]
MSSTEEESKKRAKTGDNVLISCRPVDDLHLHLRDGDIMQSLAQHIPPYVKRAIVMPNLVPPVINTDMALAYRERIMKALPAESDFQPLMTLYLTDNTTGDEIRKAKETGQIFAVKLYPAGATTNSDSGVTDISKCKGALEAMAEVGMPLLVHGEVTDSDVDFFERERVFIERHMRTIVANHPNLKVVMEHITTAAAVEFVRSCGSNVAATITCQHLIHNRNAIFEKGLRPHKYCLPILKTEADRQALLSAIQSGSTKFFMGTDSAPHPRHRKEASCCSAGCYTMHASLELYATVFRAAGCIQHLPAFVGENGANFYGLKPNEGRVDIVQEPWSIPDSYPLGDTEVVPLNAGEEMSLRAKRQS